MEKIKALIAVALLVAMLLLTYNNETKIQPEKTTSVKKVNTPVIEQDSIYKSPVSFR